MGEFDFDFFYLFNSFQSVFDYFYDFFSGFLVVVANSPLFLVFLLSVIGVAISSIVYIYIKLSDVNGMDFDTNYHHPYYSTKPLSKNLDGNNFFYKYYQFRKRGIEEKYAEERRKEKERLHKEAYEEAEALANEYFENNQNKMTVSYNGFKFYAPDWEQRNWGNTRKHRITTTTNWRGITKRTESDTTTYDETTSDIQQE